MPELRHYQEESRDFLAARRYALLADEPRVGKTPPAIRAAHKQGAQSILVATQAIAVPQWEAEIVRWWPSGPLPRFRVWSYDRAREMWASGLRGTVDVFIPDECHMAGNPEAERTKMVYGKTGFAQQSGAVWPLSGSPAPKSVASLWPVYYAFGVTKLHYQEFVDRYCTFNKWTGRVIGTNTYRLAELQKMRQGVVLRRTRKEVAPELPDIDFRFLNITPTGVDVKIPEHITDAHLPAWIDAHAKVDSEDRQAVALAKVPALVEHIVFAIENGLLDKTVVFGWHTAPLEALAAALQARGIGVGLITGKTSPKQRQWVLEQHKSGSVQVVAANLLAGGMAVDMSAADHGFFLELDWLPGNNYQAASRLVSIEKLRPVSFDVVTWPGSFDERVQKVLLTRSQELAKLYS